MHLAAAIGAIGTGLQIDHGAQAGRIGAAFAAEVVGRGPLMVLCLVRFDSMFVLPVSFALRSDDGALEGREV